jgi:hypothetical protein
MQDPVSPPTRSADKPQYTSLIEVARDNQARAALAKKAAPPPAAPAHPVLVTGVRLPFDDVFRIVLAVLAAQLIVVGIVGAFVALFWLAMR